MDAMIGATIALISKSEIRYVGTLHQVDKSNATVSLKNVRSFGTEGRMENGKKELPPSPQVFNLIMFKGSDIKDLSVLDTAPNNVTQSRVPEPPVQTQIPNTAAAPTAASIQPQMTQYPGLNHQQFPFHMMPPNMNPYLVQQAMAFAQQPHFWPQPGQNPGFYGFPPFPPPPSHPTSNSQVNPTDLSATGESEVKVQGQGLVQEFANLESITQHLSTMQVNDQDFSQKRPDPKSNTRSSGQESKKLQPTLTAELPEASNPQGQDALKIGSIMESKHGKFNEIAPRNDASWDQRSNRRGRGRGRGRGSKTVIPRSDFDFETANSHFQKQSVTEHDKIHSYSKSSFFDDISCEIKDRLTVQVDRKSRVQQDRRQNVETFGQATSNQHRGRGRGGGFRGRGGRKKIINEKPEQ